MSKTEEKISRQEVEEFQTALRRYNVPVLSAAASALGSLFRRATVAELSAERAELRIERAKEEGRREAVREIGLIFEEYGNDLTILIEKETDTTRRMAYQAGLFAMKKVTEKVYLLWNTKKGLKK